MKSFHLYPIKIEYCQEGGFFASCPMLQGCHAQGETYTQVIENIQDVIKVHLELRKNTLKSKQPNSLNLPKTLKPELELSIPIMAMA